MASGNAYQSALKAGYSEAYAKGNVSKLLENERVIAYMKERLSEVKSSKILDVQARMELLSSIAVDPAERAQDKIRAVDTLNKMDATYITQIELSGESTVNVSNNSIQQLSVEELRMFIDKADDANES